MIRNGNPFHIKGASGNAFLKELKDAGANTIRVYDTMNLKKYLVKAEELGLAVVIDIPLPRYQTNSDTIYKNPVLFAKLLEDTGKFVNRFKDHPAVLYWILGNEVYYPKLYANDFISGYNRLLEKVREIDPNHPISTTVSSSGLKKVFSILVKSPDLDFISVNNFGSLNDFTLDKNILFFWQGPYVISEWGINGPWETETTKWAAPLEETGTKKAEQYKNRYVKNIQAIDDGRCLGSLAFFWGQKQERTHTWFSLFADNGYKSQVVFELQNLWQDVDRQFQGPKIDYLLLNGQSASENILISHNREVKAALFYLKNDSVASYDTEWTVRPENWNYLPQEVEQRPDSIPDLIVRKDNFGLTFKTPTQEGPYRLFVKVSSESGYYTTANIPFYVIKEPFNL
ncbi:hypothetical protein FK220_018705 [Flavobacteriaceae bacterium TP-CH-4]|uniref:Glycoside hydrolase family 2 catalytic domain-containing protein n=1 Tax=Pelagihabitans pacificus TaxID=2696054 RepID=A0A967B3K3_9FLAO|nr:glycoside hydrolase family 2 TIM barrel-domain containing protein [Pelagihabitans pacificus]NHF61391.1 hypothetical protein [Pelagihabitans pacificus]